MCKIVHCPAPAIFRVVAIGGLLVKQYDGKGLYCGEHAGDIIAMITERG